MSQTLVLNASFEPLRAVPWTRAVCMWLDGKADILATYTERVYDAIKDWCGRMPAVIRLRKYVKTHRHKVKFSRINVFARDNFTCQYCGDQPGTEELTYDHVMPRSRGGRTTWDNIVTSCLPCNSRKSNQTPDEANMVLKTKPRKPSVRPYVTQFNSPNTPEEWLSFLYWESSLTET